MTAKVIAGVKGEQLMAFVMRDALVAAILAFCLSGAGWAWQDGTSADEPPAGEAESETADPVPLEEAAASLLEPESLRGTPGYSLAEGDIVPVVCPFGETIDYEPGELSCGLLAVRENRETDASRIIQLLYVRIHGAGLTRLPPESKTGL